METEVLAAALPAICWWLCSNHCPLHPKVILTATTDTAQPCEPASLTQPEAVLPTDPGLSLTNIISAFPLIPKLPPLSS